MERVMRAMLLTDYKNLEITDIPEPEFGADDVLVKVASCGICGSDVHGYDGSSGRRIPPLVMGHEAAGVVTDVGARVTAFKPGDRVTFDSTVYCGKCHFCRRGEVNLCDDRMVLGVSCGDYRRYGAFAEYVAVPQHIVYPIPDELSFDAAAMIEAVSIAVHAVNRTPIRIGDVAVVIGTGMIGLLTIQVLRHSAVSTIIAVDVDDTRLGLARQCGAEHTFNAKTADVPAEVQALTGGRGADVALEAVGATEPIKTAIDSLRKGGSLTLIGNVTAEIELPLQAVVTRELNLFGTCASQGEYPECIDLLARGIIDVEPLISAAAPLADGPDWFHRLYNHEPGLMKVILKP
jgi:L-iditol 2-dehydrogenase